MTMVRYISLIFSEIILRIVKLAYSIWNYNFLDYIFPY